METFPWFWGSDCWVSGSAPVLLEMEVSAALDFKAMAGPLHLTTVLTLGCVTGQFPLAQLGYSILFWRPLLFSLGATYNSTTPLGLHDFYGYISQPFPVYETFPLEFSLHLPSCLYRSPCTRYFVPVTDLARLSLTPIELGDNCLNSLALVQSSLSPENAHNCRLQWPFCSPLSFMGTQHSVLFHSRVGCLLENLKPCTQFERP